MSHEAHPPLATSMDAELRADPRADLRAGLRYEFKLVCAQSWLFQARSWIKLHPAGFVVAYPPRRVNSLYLDTPHLSSLNDNLMGLTRRRKLRLRWYGEANSGIQPILELKQKHNQLGQKKQLSLACTLDLSAPWREIMEAIRAGAPPAWRTLLQTVTQPTLLNHYQREYYVTPDEVVRVTLDYAQGAYDQRFAPRPNLTIQLPIDDTVVIEVKAAKDQGTRLREVVAWFPVSRSRNSKYAGGLMSGMG